MGATRAGLADAKEGVGQQPERYKLVDPGTIFYNPMRILLGSIAFLDEGGVPGITSPDYVVLKTKPGLLHPRWFYYWLRSDWGAYFIRTLARGAVRERMLFRRLAAAEIDVPPYDVQCEFARCIPAVERARAAAEVQLAAATRLPSACLWAQFDGGGTQAWPRRRVKEVAVLLPSKSISTNGDFEVIAVTTACLAEAGFLPAGAKPARMWTQDAAQCVISRGEILVARSNTPDLVGRVAMFDGEPRGAVASDLTVRIQTREDFMPEFLTRYLSFLYLTGYWKDRAGGASGSMKKITRGQIESERVPVPAIEIQQQVVAALKDRMAEAGRIRMQLEDQLAAINALPAALLRRAFSGAL